MDMQRTKESNNGFEITIPSLNDLLIESLRHPVCHEINAILFKEYNVKSYLQMANIFSVRVFWSGI